MRTVRVRLISCVTAGKGESVRKGKEIDRCIRMRYGHMDAHMWVCLWCTSYSYIFDQIETVFGINDELGGQWYEGWFQRSLTVECIIAHMNVYNIVTYYMNISACMPCVQHCHVNVCFAVRLDSPLLSSVCYAAMSTIWKRADLIEPITYSFNNIFRNQIFFEYLFTLLKC